MITLLLLLALCHRASPLASPLRPLTLNLRDDALLLQTKVYQYQYLSSPTGQSLANVELYSMLHVADSEYYTALRERLRDCDVVLYELITSSSNTYTPSPMPSTSTSGVSSSTASSPWSYKRQLMTQVDSPASQQLADNFGLQTQLVLPLQDKNWFVADLDAETVQQREARRSTANLLTNLASRLTGRNSQRSTLPKFFLSDAPLVTLLRLLSWFAVPCPELTVLLLDWARAGANDESGGSGDRARLEGGQERANAIGAGGLPVQVIASIVSLLAQGDFRAARKAAFAQALVTGVHDSGSWGGASTSDTLVRVAARNIECCRCLQLCLNEVTAGAIANTDNGDARPSPKRVAVLYGVYHIRDLDRRLRGMGLKPLAAAAAAGADAGAGAGAGIDSDGAADTLTAWKIPASPALGQGSLRGVAARTLTLTLGIAYLILGTLDWLWVGATVFEAGLGLASGSASDVVSGMRAASATDAASGGGDGPLVTALTAAAYVSLYLWRHAFLYERASNIGVVWDRGLFDE